MDLSIAGSESNVAVGLARQGVAVDWIGVVGDDEFGRLALRVLRAESVGVGHVRIHRTAPTGLIVFEPRLAGLTRVTYRRSGSAGADLGIEDVVPALTPAPAVLHVTGITPALGPRPRAMIDHAVTEARLAGTLVCLDVNYRAALWSRRDAADVLTPLAARSDVVMASEDEVALLDPAGTGRDETETIESLLAGTTSEVVVSRGARGATAFRRGERIDQPAVSVTVIDTVGAGDALCAGYLAALLDGDDLAARAQRAVRTAGFAVAASGDWEGLPTVEELALLDVPPGSVMR